MQPVCKKDFFGMWFPRSPALRAKWIPFLVAKTLLMATINVFFMSTVLAYDSPSSVFGDEVELRSSLSQGSKKRKTSQPLRSSTPLAPSSRDQQSQNSRTSESAIDESEVSQRTRGERMTPRYGITLPQPMYKIVEPKPLYQIVEPKPLYDGIAPEVPGQKHVPDLSSRSSSSHGSSLREGVDQPYQNSALPKMKSKVTKDGVISNVERQFSKEARDSKEVDASEEVHEVRVRAKTLRTTLETQGHDKQHLAPNVQSQKSQENLQQKRVEPSRTLPHDSSVRKKPLPSYEPSALSYVPVAAEVYAAPAKPSPRFASDSPSEVPKIDASKIDASKIASTSSHNAEALKRIQTEFKAQKADVSSDQRPALTPETYLNTVRAADQYLGIAESGGWPSLPENTVLSPGARNATVALLKKRLMISGDLGEKDAKGDMYDEALEQAVKTFQLRHGLGQTGTVSGASVEELNVSARVRYRHLKRTAERLSRQTFEFGGRYLSLNMAASVVEAVEDGRVQHRYKATIGALERQTPQLQSQIMSVTINPTWTASLAVVKDDFLPKLQKNPQALMRTGIRIVDGKGQDVEASQVDWQNPKAASLLFRYAAGATNPLGRIRFDMSSNQGNELHDTPSRKLFSNDEKTFSSTGVRITDIRHLAGWILGGQSGQTPRTLQGLINTNMIHELRLSQPLPVIYTYMTGYANEDGQVHFRADAYGLDERTQTSSQAE
jgi:L,D-transpeptidase YcbB